MEILLAIVVLSLSTLVGFSTSEKRKPKSDSLNNEDPDWAFTESCDLDSSSRK
jgi:hypothetical protein